MRELYGLRDDAAIARELNRPVQSVRKLAADIFRSKRRTGPWTAQEVQNLKKYLGVSSAEVIARILGRELAEVRAQIEDLGRIQHNGLWAREEIVDFKRIYGTRTDQDLALIFGRSVEAVRGLAEEHKLAKDKAFLRKLDGTTSTRMPRWTGTELEKLRAMYADHANLDIAAALDRSVKSIVSKAHNLGLKKDSERLRAMGRENVSLRYHEHPK